MQKWIKSVLLVGLIVLLTIAMAGCRFPSSEQTPIVSLTSSPSAKVESRTPTLTQTIISSLTTTTLPPTQGYPQPVFPSPTPQTPLPYPYPFPTSQEFPIERTPTASPEPTKSATPPPVNLPEASPTVREPSATPTVTETALPVYPGPEETGIPLYPGPEETETQLYPGPQDTETQPYPGPQETETPPYPGPQVTNTTAPTPKGTKSTPKASQSVTATPKPGGTVSPSPSLTPGTGTPGATPTELPPRGPLSPPPAGSNVSIWHSWNSKESEMLGSIVQSFQKLYPDVTFTLNYVPLDDLLTNYQEAAYLGHGPSLLLGPAQWGPQLFLGQLVTDLTPYVPTDYLSGINPAALASGRLHEALISLPLSQHGVVMYRNTALIANAPQTMEELSDVSHTATRAGKVGSYLERGAYFSSAALLGLGGKLANDNNLPAFDELPGLDWFELLRAYDAAGAVTFNTNRDIDMFKRGRVGIIIDGTWNIATLTQYISVDQLAIDPWPAFGKGHMSGWVEADSVFLNSNVTDDDRFAALAFVGYLLDPNVQLRLAEVGHIPSVMATMPRDHLTLQAMAAFSSGVPYPITMDDNILNLYFTALNRTIRDVFVSGVSPEDALKSASEEITRILINSTAVP